jgi:cytochrome b subunit of formate dehydrogenase
MKTAAIIILIVGLLMTLYTGFGVVTKEKVVDLGAVEITKDKHHTAAWSPLVGIGVMVIGGALLMVAKKK